MLLPIIACIIAVIVEVGGGLCLDARKGADLRMSVLPIELRIN